jgi:hypothetical protein
MFRTSNIVCQSVNLTDELKIGLEYDVHDGLLNIFVKNTGNNIQFPSQINILSNENKDFLSSSEYPQGLFRFVDCYQFDLIIILMLDLKDEIIDISYKEENEPMICIELLNIYVYDLYDENENIPCQTMITSPSLLFSSSSSSSCFDDHTIDNDDGYSTHSLDDTEQQQYSLSILPSKFIIPFVPYQHQEEYVSSIRRLINQMMWLSPFRKTFKRMMINHLFN